MVPYVLTFKLCCDNSLKFFSQPKEVPPMSLPKSQQDYDLTNSVNGMSNL